MARGISLRRRLTWYVIAVLLFVSGASGAVVYLSARHEIDEVFNDALEQTAHIVDGLVTREEIEINGDRLQHALGDVKIGRKGRPTLFFAVFDSGGELLLHSDQAPEITGSSARSGAFEFSADNRKWFAYGLDSSRDDLLIVVGQRSKDRTEITEHIGSGLLVPLVLLLPLVLWLLWKLVGIAMRPLDEVIGQVRRQDIRRLQPLDASGVPLEIDPLVQALNRMIANLDAAYARERRFVSDASHELRNPLASLLINVDNAIEESSDEAARDSLESMKASIRRLSHLVSQLLKLSHLDNPVSGRTLEQVELCRICRRVAKSLAAQAEANGQSLELELADGECSLHGVEALLESLVNNLLDNAIKHGGANARVRLRCARQGRSISIEVDDSGPGLSNEQRERARERFYRAGDTNAVGAGLGLSIVEAIAEMHQARVELDDSDLGGLSVRVRFEID